MTMACACCVMVSASCFSSFSCSITSGIFSILQCFHKHAYIAVERGQRKLFYRIRSIRPETQADAPVCAGDGNIWLDQDGLCSKLQSSPICYCSGFQLDDGDRK